MYETSFEVSANTYTFFIKEKNTNTFASALKAYITGCNRLEYILMYKR